MAELAHPDVRAASQYQDHCSKKAQEFLASRAEKVLTAIGENQHPVFKVFLQEKQARKSNEATSRPCKKRIGSNIGRGPTGMVPGAGPDQTCACVGMGRSQPPVCSVST